MSVQKKRISKRRTRIRRSHHALQKPTIATCQKCHSPLQPHRACPSCGHYNGRDVLQLQAKVERKLIKKQERAAKAEASTPTAKGEKERPNATPNNSTKKK